MKSLYFISNYLISDVQKFNMNNLSLLEIIFSNSLLNVVIFHRNIYANSSVFKTSRYDINLVSLINQSTTIRIELYKTFISDFFNYNNLTMKFITTKTYDQFNINNIFVSLYILCLVNFILWHILYFST